MAKTSPDAPSCLPTSCQPPHIQQSAACTVPESGTRSHGRSRATPESRYSLHPHLSICSRTCSDNAAFEILPRHSSPHSETSVGSGLSTHSALREGNFLTPEKSPSPGCRRLGRPSNLDVPAFLPSAFCFLPTVSTVP